MTAPISSAFPDRKKILVIDDNVGGRERVRADILSREKDAVIFWAGNIDEAELLIEMRRQIADEIDCVIIRSFAF